MPPVGAYIRQDRAVELKVEVGDEAQVEVPYGRGGAAELAVDLPVDLAARVVRAGVAGQLHFAGALGTVDRPDQHVLGEEAVAAGVTPAVHADDQRVADHRPAGLGRPGRLDHVGARLVAARDGHPLVRPEAQQPGGPIEHGAEDRRRIEARQAHPLERAVG
jgi:hypothetical protein